MKDSGFYDDIFSSKDELLTEKLLLAWKLLKYIETHKKKYYSDYTKAVRLTENKKAEELTKDEKVEIVRIYRLDFLFHSEYFILNLFKDFLKENKLDITKEKAAILSTISKIDSNDEIVVKLYHEITTELSEFIDNIRGKQGYYHNKFFKNERSIGLVRNHFNQKYSFIEII